MKTKSDTHVLRATHHDGSISFLQRATTVTEHVAFGGVETAHVFKSHADAVKFATLFYMYKKDWFGLILHINNIVIVMPEPYKE